MNIQTLTGYISEWLGVVAVLYMLTRLSKLKLRVTKFQAPQKEKRPSLIVSGALLLISFTFFAFLSKTISFPDDSTLQTLIQRLAVALIGVVPVAYDLYRRKQPLFSIGWTRQPNIRISLLLAMTLGFLSIIFRGKTSVILNGVLPQEGIYLLLLIGICFVEESIFRGYLQNRFNAWLGEKYGWALASAVFLLFQIPRLLFIPGTFWISLGIIAVQSILSSWIMKKGGHIFAPAIYRIVSEWISLLA